MSVVSLPQTEDLFYSLNYLGIQNEIFFQKNNACLPFPLMQSTRSNIQWLQALTRAEVVGILILEVRGKISNSENFVYSCINKWHVDLTFFFFFSHGCVLNR